MCDDNEIVKDTLLFFVKLRMSHWNSKKPFDLQIWNGNITIKEIPISDSAWVRNRPRASSPVAVHYNPAVEIVWVQ